MAHEVHKKISQSEMLAALPKEYQALPRHVVELQVVSARLGETDNFDWAGERQKQAEEVRAKLLPLINNNPGWRVQYFGLAPIPLIMDLGYMIGGMETVDIYLQRHDTKSWAWPSSSHSSGLQIETSPLVGDVINAEGALVIRVSISHRVNPSDTEAVISSHLGAIDIGLTTPNEDALESPADLEAVRAAYEKVVDWAASKRPNADLHVFASVTVGVALRLGTAINKNIHQLIHAYQYSNHTSPRHTHALILQRDDRQVLPLTAEQISAAGFLRGWIDEDLATIRAYAAASREQEKSHPTEDWLESVLPGENATAFYGPLRELAKIGETPLVESLLDTTTTEVSDNFAYDPPGRLWRIDDRLLTSIAAGLTNPADQRQAGRLLLLHEGVHLATHRLTGATAPQIRRFPKLVEELDYQADVWAFLHEYAIQLAPTNPSDSGIRAFFINVVSVALNTFWAFDAQADHRRMEIRRLNRYLIWYWQLLKLEEAKDWAGVIKVLANRPVIEIAGPKIETSDDRVFYSLDAAKCTRPEIAILYKRRIVRYGDAAGSPVADILAGFREANGEKIRRNLRSFSDQAPD